MASAQAPVLVTGFGPFLQVEENPSGLIAGRLELDPPPGVPVRQRLLPVSIERSARELERALEELEPGPSGILCLGVHPGAGFRLEQRARGLLSAEKPDVDGRLAAGVILPGPDEVWSELDLEPLASALEAAGASNVSLSDDAGGYVCERIYHHALCLADSRGIPALFLHVPPASVLDIEEQTVIVRAMLVAFHEQCLG